MKTVRRYWREIAFAIGCLFAGLLLGALLSGCGTPSSGGGADGGAASSVGDSTPVIDPTLVDQTWVYTTGQQVLAVQFMATGAYNAYWFDDSAGNCEVIANGTVRSDALHQVYFTRAAGKYTPGACSFAFSEYFGAMGQETPADPYGFNGALLLFQTPNALQVSLSPMAFNWGGSPNYANTPF